MNKVTSIKKGEETLESIVEDSSLAFKSLDEGLNLLSFSIGLRALGLSNRDLQSRKISNYIRASYLQIQLICSVILCQITATAHSNYRKILRNGVDIVIFIRTRSHKDSRNTLYSLYR